MSWEGGKIRHNTVSLLTKYECRWWCWENSHVLSALSLAGPRVAAGTLSALLSLANCKCCLPPHHTTVATLDHSATTERSRHNTSGRSFNFILTLHIKTTLELHQPVFSITYNNINTSLWLSFSTHWCRKPIFHRGQVVVSICCKIHIYEYILPSFFHLKRLKGYRST